jgi:hypothetical protein
LQSFTAWRRLLQEFPAGVREEVLPMLSVLLQIVDRWAHVS